MEQGIFIQGSHHHVFAATDTDMNNVGHKSPTDWKAEGFENKSHCGFHVPNKDTAFIAAGEISSPLVSTNPADDDFNSTGSYTAENHEVLNVSLALVGFHNAYLLRA